MKMGLSWQFTRNVGKCMCQLKTFAILCLFAKKLILLLISPEAICHIYICHIYVIRSKFQKLQRKVNFFILSKSDGRIENIGLPYVLIWTSQRRDCVGTIWIPGMRRSKHFAPNREYPILKECTSIVLTVAMKFKLSQIPFWPEQAVLITEKDMVAYIEGSGIFQCGSEMSGKLTRGHLKVYSYHKW